MLLKPRQWVKVLKVYLYKEKVILFSLLIKSKVTSTLDEIDGLTKPALALTDAS